ncbi:MAG: thioredoxin domain-containing protein [Bacteroidota bacterium]
MKRGSFIAVCIALMSMGTLSAQDTTAPITLTKYSDYQCPACKYFGDVVSELKEMYGDQLVVEYKHYPLNMHQYAQLAARTVEAARVQGKGQEMHQMVFDGQAVWSRGNAEVTFINYANELKLDIDQFKTDMNSADMQRIVMADKRDGRNLGVSSTPTFFLNGKKIEKNPGNATDFKTYIDANIK